MSKFLFTDNQNFGMEYINKVCLLSKLKEEGFENFKADLVEKASSYDIVAFEYDYIRDKTNIKLNMKSFKIIENPVNSLY